MSIPLGDAATLGALRGVTDVLPLSGSAHEALAQVLFDRGQDLALATVLDAVVAAAALVFLRKRAWSTLEEGLRGIGHPSLLGETTAGRDAIFVGVASVVTAFVAFVVDRVLMASTYAGSPYVVGACLLASAVVVASTRFAPSHEETPAPAPAIAWAAAVVMGVAQGCAVVPGLSRTGLTIASLVWMGVGEERAFELSFLAAIPALTGAAVVAGAHARFVGESALVLGAAAVVAFAFASLALRVLRAVTDAGKIRWFAVYLAPLAFATLAWEYARP
jgi:undecaprenyl-diphosphatase